MVSESYDFSTLVIKQDPGGASEQAEDSSALYGDQMDPREQHHHEQQRLQDQMRHMQHMHHMGMGPGFLPRMDLAAMFGNVSEYFAVLSNLPCFSFYFFRFVLLV